MRLSNMLKLIVAGMLTSAVLSGELSEFWQCCARMLWRPTQQHSATRSNTQQHALLRQQHTATLVHSWHARMPWWPTQQHSAQ
jgi:hypothetical protein